MGDRVELTLICSKCRVPANGWSDGSMGCPKCDAKASPQDVEKAKQVAGGQFSHDVAKQLQETMKSAFGRVWVRVIRTRATADPAEFVRLALRLCSEFEADRTP